MQFKLLCIFLLLTQTLSTDLLYEGKTTAVVELDGNKFKELVVNEQSSPLMWVVVFYAHWCGHCQHFAPEFIKIAEAHRNDSKLRFAAMDCASPSNFKFGEDDLCRLQDVRAYPTIFLYKDGKKEKELAKVSSDLEKDVAAIADKTGSNENIENGSNKETSVDLVLESPDEGETGRSLKSDPDSYIHDASLAMFSILHDSVFQGNTEKLGEPQIDDLEHLLHICARSLLPEDFREGCLELIHILQENPHELFRKTWIEEVHAVFGDTHWEGKDYASCKDFSCGMWRLLHLITLSSSKAFPPEETMKSTRFVVDKYFSCEICRGNFLSHYDECDFERCSMKVDDANVAAWLIRLHNGVNTRLGKSRWPDASSGGYSDAVDLLRTSYGLTVPSNQVFSTPMLSILLILALVFVIASWKYASSTAVDRMRFSVTKKYQPLNIV
jgi:thiol-disulfide isomerase/thioredoxin